MRSPASMAVPAPKVRVWILSMVLVLGTAGGLMALPDALKVSSSHVWIWVALVGVFTASEKLIFHIEARQDAVSYTPSEFGLALGVLFLFPLELVVARCLGALIGMVLWRRQPSFKLAFNLAHFAFEAMLAVVIFTSISTLSDDLLVTWSALVLGLIAALVVGGSAVALAVAQFEGGAVERVRREIAGAPLFHLPPALLAAVIGASVLVEPRLGFLAATPVPAIWIMIRRHGALNKRHLDLEHLHRFGRAVADSDKLHDIATAAVRSMADGTAADAVILRLWSGEGETVDAVAGVAVDVNWLPDSPDDPEWADILERRIAERFVDDGLHPASTALRGAGLVDGIVVPVSDDQGPLGVGILANRADTTEAFDHDGLDSAVAMIQQLSIAARRSRVRARIEHDAAHDRLTGLSNRSELEASLGEFLQQSDPLAVFLIDLDKFKEINDSFGHEAGDAVLMAAAERIRAVVPADAVVARFGGDEFAIAVRGLSERAGERLANSIALALEETIDIGTATVAITCSIGIAHGPSQGREVATLLRSADLAMYDAKSSASRTCVFHPDLDSTGATRLALLSDLRSVVHNGELDVYFQPKVHLRSGIIVGAEALARWTHPLYGPVGPDTFIPLAEQAGLMEELTSQVLLRAATAAAEWDRRGWDIGVAVNVSPQSLLDERLEAVVADTLRVTGLPAERLTLEITEKTMMGNASRTHRVLHGLTRLGVRLSVDDFGTGYSSLTNLRHYPVAELKIDRSFVHDLINTATDDVIVRSTIEMAHNLGLSVVAEGVEDQIVRDRLGELGCDIVQGYFDGAPMPLEKLLFAIEERRSQPSNTNAAKSRRTTWIETAARVLNADEPTTLR